MRDFECATQSLNLGTQAVRFELSTKTLEIQHTREVSLSPQVGRGLHEIMPRLRCKRFSIRCRSTSDPASRSGWAAHVMAHNMHTQTHGTTLSPPKRK
eukprot:218532-Prymnesium_polylepis.2